MTRLETDRRLRPYQEAVAVGAVASVGVAGTSAARNRSCCTGHSNLRSCSPAADPSVAACPSGGGGVAGTLSGGGLAVGASCEEGRCCVSRLASRQPCTACASGPGRSRPRE